MFWNKGYSVYDEVNKVSMDFNFNPKLEKVALFEAERIGNTRFVDVLATGSLNFINAPVSLVFPNHFRLSYVSSFVENIIPLTFIEV